MRPVKIGEFVRFAAGTGRALSEHFIEGVRMLEVKTPTLTLKIRADQCVPLPRRPPKGAHDYAATTNCIDGLLDEMRGQVDEGHEPTTVVTTYLHSSTRVEHQAIHNALKAPIEGALTVPGAHTLGIDAQLAGRALLAAISK